MPGHSRSANGVASLAYVPRIPTTMARPCICNRDGRDKRGHDNVPQLHASSSAHSREAGNPAWVPAFAGTSGRQRTTVPKFANPARTRRRVPALCSCRAFPVPASHSSQPNSSTKRFRSWSSRLPTSRRWSHLSPASPSSGNRWFKQVD